ncbi:MAG: hypothetical protein ACTHK7_17155 [Aureliella sp.]
MGTLYRKFCPTCDRNRKPDVTFHGFVGAALNHSPMGGEIVSGGYAAYLADDGSLVPLPHPFESRLLRAAGTTLAEAALRGRLLSIHELICADCGAENTTATLRNAGTGCITGLALATIAIACNVLLFSFHPIVEIGLVCMAMFTPELLIDRYLRFRYRKNASPYQTSRCRRCGSGRLLPLSIARKYLWTCPRCKQKSMRIEIAGRS